MSSSNLLLPIEDIELKNVTWTWKGLIYNLLALSVMPLILYWISLYVYDFHDWEIVAGAFIILPLFILIPTAIYNLRFRRRFRITSPYLYIDFEAYAWDDITQLKVTQREADYPEMIIYLANGDEIDHPLKLNKKDYQRFNEAVQHYLGDRWTSFYQKPGPTMTRLGSSTRSGYHDPTEGGGIF